MNFCKYGFRGLLFLAVLFNLILSATSCGRKSGPQKDYKVPARIISLAPSITETLFALGLADKVVGVTSFCTYPPEVKQVSKVGTFMDPNFEAILTLKPDMVITLKEDTKVKDFLHKKGLAYLAIDNHNIQAILESITLIGSACGKGSEAELLRGKIFAEFDTGAHVSTLSGEDSRPQVLLCVGRDNVGAGVLSKIWVAGPSTYYSEIIDAVGGANVIIDSLMDYSTVSSEAVIRLKPDIIIDVMANMSKFTPEQVKKDWENLTMVPAVKNGMIFCLTGDYITIPGPRVVLLLRDIRTIIRDYFDKVRKKITK